MPVIVANRQTKTVVVTRVRTVGNTVRVNNSVVIPDKGVNVAPVVQRTTVVGVASTGVQGIPGDAADLPGTTDQLAEGTVNKYARTFDFTQSAPDTTWTINHNLGFLPAVELRTVGGVEFDADVQHPNTNQTIVYLLTALAGTARLN